jgi:signal transduction histidine kinase
VECRGGRLTLVVADDGRGGADRNLGSGLSGLADRVSALGGRLRVISPAGGGTTVTAELPIAHPLHEDTQRA